MGELSCKKILIEQFLKSVTAVNPAKLITENLKIDSRKIKVCDRVYDIKKSIFLIGFGKAVLGMASRCEKILGKHLKRGVICGPVNIRQTFESNSEYSLEPDSVIEVHEGAENNLPDEKAEAGTEAIIDLLKSLNHETDNLIVLISGGGSALLPKPKPPITLSEKLKTINLLFSSGADINEVNTVRKRLSLVKGGGLACLSFPVKTICLIISDVVNDSLEIIASGPTVPNSDRDSSALDILQKYNLTNKVPLSVLNETQKMFSGDNFPIISNPFSHVDNFLIGNNVKAINAGKQYLETAGFKTLILSTKVKGSVDNVANFYIKMLSTIISCLENSEFKSFSKCALFGECCFDIEDSFLDELDSAVKKFSERKKMCIIAGGETTVRVTGSGRGGRNQELVLMVCMGLHHLKTKHPLFFKKYDVAFLSAGTDGVDGPTDAAGAVGDVSVIDRAERSNLDPYEYRKSNDSYNFFNNLDHGSCLIKTGHTGTNVMDIHSLLMCERPLSS